MQPHGYGLCQEAWDAEQSAASHSAFTCEQAYDPSISAFKLEFINPSTEPGTGNVLLTFIVQRGDQDEPTRGWTSVERECVDELKNLTQSLSIDAREYPAQTELQTRLCVPTKHAHTACPRTRLLIGA